MSNTADVYDLSRRLPTDAEVKSAAEAAEAIARASSSNGGQLPFRDENGDELFLSRSLCELITDVLGHVAKREMVTIVSTGALLSTQEAADMLNVSRPFVSKLLSEGKMDFIPVGTHRRIELNELMRYKMERDNRRAKALDRVAELGEDLGE